MGTGTTSSPARAALERTIAGINRCRRLAKDDEYLNRTPAQASPKGLPRVSVSVRKEADSLESFVIPLWPPIREAGDGRCRLADRAGQTLRPGQGLRGHPRTLSSSNAPSPGSIVAAASPRTTSILTEPPSPSSVWPASGLCPEGLPDIVIPHEFSRWTIRGK